MSWLAQGVRLCFALLAVAAFTRDAPAQTIAPQMGVASPVTLPENSQPWTSTLSPAQAGAVQSGSRPRWIKWGLIGAAAGAVTFGVLSRASIEEPNPLLPDVLLGAAVGFVTIGGAVAVYDFVCKPDSRSERAGLC